MPAARRLEVVGYRQEIKPAVDPTIGADFRFRSRVPGMVRGQTGETQHHDASSSARAGRLDLGLDRRPWSFRCCCSRRRCGTAIRCSQWDTGGYLARWYEGYLVPSRSTVFGIYLHLRRRLGFLDQSGHPGAGDAVDPAADPARARHGTAIRGWSRSASS